MRSRAEQMIARLRELRGTTPDIEASAIVSVDGLIIASDLPAEVEENPQNWLPWNYKEQLESSKATP